MAMFKHVGTDNQHQAETANYWFQATPEGRQAIREMGAHVEDRNDWDREIGVAVDRIHTDEVYYLDHQGNSMGENGLPPQLDQFLMRHLMPAFEQAQAEHGQESNDMDADTPRPSSGPSM